MKHRREIDGLRALAVVPVILFHAGFETFAGGFVGVDVFFVISGYLISGILLAQHEAGRFSLLDFFERRARRILPALFAMLAACLPFAWLWLQPQDMRRFSESLAAVSAFGSNILFWKTSGYFDPNTELKPLLHTWSLAVEEQYYVFFPLLLMLMWRLGKRWLVALLTILFAISLAAADRGSVTDREATFYLLPTRGWELLMGALLACAPKRTLPKWLNEVGGMVGMGLIAYSILTFDERTPFPSVYALAPTAGTALILLCAGSNTLSGRLLGTRPLVGLGLISYSAYLWHQPIFAFAKHRMILEPSKPVFAALALVAVTLGYLSWRYVETPFRDRTRFTRAQVLAAAAICSVCFAAFGLAGHFNAGFPNRDPEVARLSEIRTVEQSLCHNEQRRTAPQIVNGDLCIVGADVPPTVAIIGDSHAGALFEAFRGQEFSLYAISGGFCAPMLNFRLNQLQAGDCVDTTVQAIRHIVKNPAVTDVVLVAQWADYTQGYRDDGFGKRIVPALASDKLGQARFPDENKVIFERTLRRTVTTLQDAGKHVIVVKPTPEFARPVLPTLMKIRQFSESLSYIPRIRAQDYNRRNAEVLDVFGQLQGVTFVETKDLFCSAGICSSVDSEGRPLFSDTNHVTEFGADRIAQALLPILHK